VQKFHHNTQADVRGYLGAALGMVEALDPPEDLRAVVFDKACNLLSSATVAVEPSDVNPIAVPGVLLNQGKPH